MDSPTSDSSAKVFKLKNSDNRLDDISYADYIILIG